MVENELKELIISKYRSLRQFALDIDMPYSTIDTMLKKGIGKAGVLNVIKICNELGIDTDALADGYIKEKTVSDIPMTVSEINHIKKYRSLSDYDKETVNGLVNRLSDKPTEFVQLMPPITIPYYGHIASAGTGQFVFDDIPPEMIEIENCMENMHVDFAIGVNGNSMEPTYSDGDTLLVKKQDSINIGEIGIFMIDGEAFVKELGKGVLISHNKDYEDKPIDENTICLGKVIGKHI